MLKLLGALLGGSQKGSPDAATRVIGGNGECVDVELVVVGLFIQADRCVMNQVLQVLYDGTVQVNGITTIVGHYNTDDMLLFVGDQGVAITQAVVFSLKEAGQDR